uniref:ATP-dependent RNA helicase DDX49/DBP8 n=1 Tax=Tetraselmis sp. GSL018 TaxID=582737 RepID=A0A061REB1_9CHLO
MRFYSPELVPQQNVETSTFKGLGVSEWLQTVCRGLGMTKPTQVQEGCIPAILAGKDVIGTAQTGSGKTAAFALPILQKLSREPYGVFALVLTPTRELAFQLADQFRALGSGMSLKEQVVVGGLEIQQQCKALTRRPHVVIATPGRLKALIDHDPDIKAAFRRTAFLVLDEADRLLEPSFEEELSTILRAVPTKRQTLLFSATMTKSLTVLAEQLMKDAYRFAAYEGLRTAERLQQDYVFVPAKVKEVYLAHLLGSLEGLKIRSAIIFTATRSKCQLLQEILNELEIGAVSLHSGKPQSARLSALDAFRSRLAPILIATDVASRGLDIPTVDLVVNFDLPTLARDYVHRVGRTARAGRRGWCVSFVTQFDVELVHRVEALIGSQLTKYEMDEAEVLKGITKVYTAKRTAAMRLAEQREDAENRRRTRAK